MKQITIALLLAIISTGSMAQMNVRHGLLTTVGKSSMSGVKYNIDADFWEGLATMDEVYENYYYNLSLGYKFRLQPTNKRYFYDAELTLGFKKIAYIIYWLPTDAYFQLPNQEDGHYNLSTPSGYVLSYHASLAMSINYRLFKGLYAGAGIIPSYRYKEEASIPPLANKFDMPVFAKIGYDFRFIDIAFSYQLGLTNMMQDKYIKQGRINDWQLQLFIPF